MLRWKIFRNTSITEQHEILLREKEREWDREREREINVFLKIFDLNILGLKLLIHIIYTSILHMYIFMTYNYTNLLHLIHTKFMGIKIYVQC